jgi:hypothetical protein
MAGYKIDLSASSKFQVKQAPLAEGTEVEFDMVGGTTPTFLFQNGGVKEIVTYHQLEPSTEAGRSSFCDPAQFWDLNVISVELWAGSMNIDLRTRGTKNPWSFARLKNPQFISR